MTGLTVNMLSTFENGKGATLNNFLLICRALHMQPRELLVDDMSLDTLYELPPESIKRIEATKKIDNLVLHSDFFDTPKRVSDVLQALEYDRSESNKFSVYLSGYCKEGHLDSVKEGNIRKYWKQK